MSVGPTQDLIVPTNQFNSPTQDKNVDENARDNCGMACVTTILRYYHDRNNATVRSRLTALGYSDGYVAPDTIKDWLFKQGTFNVISYNDNLVNALAHFGNIPSVTKVPSGCHNYSNGLLDLEWVSMRDSLPVIALFYYIDGANVIHNGTDGTVEIDHWRLPFYQVTGKTTSMDPAGGLFRTEDWAFHCSVSKQLIVAPVLPL